MSGFIEGESRSQATLFPDLKQQADPRTIRP